MVLGFFKGVYNYLFPTSLSQNQPPYPPITPTVIPQYNQYGQIIGYSHVSPGHSTPLYPPYGSPSFYHTYPPPLSQQGLPFQHFPTNPTLSHPINLTPFQPSATITTGFPSGAPRAPSPVQGITLSQPPDPAVLPATTASTSLVVPTETVPNDGVIWDGWPDGPFERLYSFREFRLAGELAVHWACTPKGGDKKGDDRAEEWQQGKRTGRRCNGVLRCGNRFCTIVVRPQTRTAKIAQQLERRCKCGDKLRHEDCTVISWLNTFKYGVYYINGGLHEHPRPTHILHLLTAEKERFDQIIFANPKAGSLALLVGSGPGTSVAEISPVLMNADRIKAEKRRVTGGRGATREFVDDFSDFEAKHPGFVVYSQFGMTTVVILQTRFMLSQLIKEHIIEDAVNGIVSDAAHGFWRDKSNLLMISSTYCLALRCWVPGIMTYSNGASEKHYELHFHALFKTMAEEAQRQNTEVTDDLFRNVVDFSDAQRSGFILAFVEFWTERSEERDEFELRSAAEALLKGCQQHFRNQITRVKKISGVIHPSLSTAFENRALALLSTEDPKIFIQWAEALIRDFPKVEGWLSWWMRPCHAKMLFSPFRDMAEGDWDSIPDTTNAEEAMHWKIYSAVGKNHGIMDGLESLWLFAEHYQLLMAGHLSGIKTSYGQREPWKNIKDKIGRTKPSRAPEKRRPHGKSDGRPPDTSRQLLIESTLKRKHAKSPSTRTKKHPSYLWDNNSCWLDTSLELIFNTITRDHAKSFLPRSASMNQSESLWPLYEAMNFRQQLSMDPAMVNNITATKSLSLQRDGLRTYLKSHRIITSSTDGMDSLFGWLGTMLNHRSDRTQKDTQAYFQAHYLVFRACTGGPEDPHIQLTTIPNTRSTFSLTTHLSRIHNGDVRKWFRTLIKSKWNPTKNPHCWRDRDGNILCDGAASSQILYFHLPIMLIIELEPTNEDDDGDNKWIFPKTLRPLTQEAELIDGVVYDVVGRALFNPESQHFTARFSPDKVTVYHYDGMKHGGDSICDNDMRIITHLAGPAQLDLKETHTRAVVYHLRGGTMAQERFTRDQTLKIEGEFPIQLSPGSEKSWPEPMITQTGIDRIPDEDRFWLNNPHMPSTTDYVDKRPSQTGKERKSAGKTLKRKRAPDISPEEEAQPLPCTEAKKIAAGKTPQQSTLKKGFLKGRRAQKVTNIPYRAPVQSVSPVIERQKKRARTLCVLPSSDSEPENDAAVSVPKTPPSPHSENPASRDVEMGDGDRSEFPFYCRCGVKGNGHDLSDDEQVIQCNSCCDWSHIACQREGRASNLAPKAKFTCDFCAPLRTMAVAKPRSSGKRESRPYRIATRTAKKVTPLSRRLLPGKGALAKRGKYWYPVRLIMKSTGLGEPKWTVQWWKGCQFRFLGGVAPGCREVLDEADIVDELWNDCDQRRQIRLGRWMHACDIPSDEDTILDFQNVPYTPDIHTILLPHCHLLASLLDFKPSEELNDEHRQVPAAVHVRGLAVSKKPGKRSNIDKLMMGGAVPDAGDLTPRERAQIQNWFFNLVPGAKADTTRWIGRVPLAHAFTVVLASWKADKLGNSGETPTHPIAEAENRALLWKRAWDYQCRTYYISMVDVDLESLALLEERMFENSKQAGIAGNQQWGLDVGAHQGKWYPYGGLPVHWNHNDRMESESEVQPGCDFSDGSLDEVEMQRVRVRKEEQERPRPQPRPITKFKFASCQSLV